MPEGRESPSPERQTGRQVHDPPGSGQGYGKTDDKQDKDPKSQLDDLESNPKDVMEDARKKIFAKPGEKPE
ncbi:hypothetical protein B0J13DRAFT_175292 [Dactylonectria estremocensis]|uniref:Uncharacterized protein n=1 Tax=Dactylonectria estremocensis TaxID=1079267 RepID=A0A9P9FD58_9HYPO|nr:hypothetical protein B0J13DRAFT_175292 [Dactylonectria estremocensis]